MFVVSDVMRNLILQLIFLLKIGGEGRRGGVLYDRFVSANLCIGGIELQEIIRDHILRDGARRSSLSWNMGDNRHRYIDCP